MKPALMGMAVDYTYNATVLRVVDGDTVAVVVDLGFHVEVDMLCRLTGINARELSQPGGPEARDHLKTFIAPGDHVIIRSVKADKYAGRFDGLVENDQGITLNTRMVADGYAAAWDGTGTRPNPPWPIPTT